MKSLLTIAAAVCLSLNSFAQSNPKTNRTMKLNAGIITQKLKETKAFYTEVLGFGVTFENEFYLLMHTPGKGEELSFLLPNHPSQQSLFHKPFKGEGVYLTIEVENVEEVYTRLKKKGAAMKIALRDEPWGDKHFAIEDPNGVGIDIVQYTPPEKGKE